MQDTKRLANFPISFFAAVMGLAGLTIAWEKTQHTLDIDLSINAWLVGATATVFVVLSALYAAKLVRYRNEVIEELRHPIKLSFFPTISISLLLLYIAFMPLSHAVGQVLWLAGTTLHLAITLLLFAQLGRFTKLGFFLSWWAYSFPVAAIAIASLLMYEQTDGGAYLVIGGGLLLVLTGIVALLLVRTVGAIRKHGICVPER